jgi:phage gp45-like
MHELTRLGHRVRSLFGRGRVNIVDDAGPVQLLQADMGPIAPDGSSLSIIDNIPRLAEFGFSSNPPAQSDIAVLNLGGDRGNNVAIATGHQAYRVTGLNPGDVCIYDIRSGQTVRLTAAGVTLTDAWGNTVAMAQGQMTLTHATQVTVSAPTILLDGDVQLGSASGGKPVARVGDPVSSGGTISAGSAHVTSD